MEKSADRLKILERIAERERKGQFDLDVEDDPETIVLLPDQIDYLNEKLSSKIKTYFANIAGTKFFEGMIKNKDVIIDKIIGIENFLKVKSGALITCNHFNAFDNYAVWRAIKPYMGRKKLYKVIREGNYTNSPPPFGFVMRNCNTLPLSSNVETMKKFMNAVSVLLKRGEKILIYPEQAMWWNYRKPRPCKVGAYKFAVVNNVPIIPVLITLEDSDIIGGDGFPVQKYTINFLEPIYPNNELAKNDNIEYMRSENYRLWKDCYESIYKIPLTYTCDAEKK